MSVSWNCEEAAELRDACGLVQILMAVQDIAICVILSDVVSTDRAYRHGEFRVDDDVLRGDRAPLDLHS